MSDFEAAFQCMYYPAFHKIIPWEILQCSKFYDTK